ncbi:MAG: hypothetical protein ABIJ91_04145 [Candidatus Kuenenbacteria bacterium]
MDKDKKKKIGILFFTALSVVLIMAVIFFVMQSKKNSQKALVNYAPKTAVLFIELNLSDESLDDNLGDKDTVGNILKEFSLDNDLPQELWQAREKIERIALLKIPAQDKKDDLYKVWLIRSINGIREFEALSLHNYYFSVVSKNTALLSRSLKAINAVNQTAAIDREKGIEHFGLNGNDNLVYGYVKNEYLENFFKEELANYDFIKKYIAIKTGDITDWKINLAEDKILIHIGAALNGDINLNGAMTDKAGGIQPIVNAITLNKFSLPGLIEILKSELNNERDNNWSFFVKYMEDKYKINISDLYTFFEQPAILVVQPKNIIASWDEALKMSSYYYTLILKKNNGDDDAFIDSLEILIQNYLAFKYPAAKETVLPDKTFGTELVADVQSYALENVKGYKNLKTIKKNDFEFNYLNNQDIIIMGNCKNLLERVLRSYDKENIGNFQNFDISFDFKMIESEWANYFNVGIFSATLQSNKLYIDGEIELEK